jgi:hypothetical protein
LVERDQEIGARLIQALDEAGFEVRSALWLYQPESERWKLVIASPLVDRRGTRAAYSAIDDVLRSTLNDADLRLDDIIAMSTKSDVIRALHTVIHTEPREISGIRLTGNMLNRILIDDAYIYRVA